MSKTKWTTAFLVLVCSLVAVLPYFQFSPTFASVDGHADYVSTDTREGRLAVFDNVWETIDERYYDPHFAGIDWNAPRTMFRQAAADARGSYELYEVLRRMVSSLRDPHTRVYSPEEKFDWWNPRFVSMGLTIREIEGVPTVVQVDPKSDPARAGIRAGDQLESIDGVSASYLVEQRIGASQSLLHSNRSEGVRAVATLLEGVAGSSTKLGWKGRAGKVKVATFRRFWNQRELGFRISQEEHKYLVIELEAFTQPLVLELMRALKDKLGNARGVVLDLRNNGGGDADAMAEFAAIFLGQGVSLGSFTNRAGESFQLNTHAKSIFSASWTSPTRLPLVVLMSERTSSAAEILAAVLQAQGRARLVGAATCGCVLAIRSRHTLPDDGVLDVSEFDYQTADGIRLEGRGVQPEDLIQHERRDLYSKRDRARQRAREMLNEDGRQLR